MKSTLRALLYFIFLLGLIYHLGCSTTGEVDNQYILTVSLANGVSGIPATGTYVYDENQTVTYSYTLEVGFRNLVVFLNDVAIADSGIITMDNNHVLRVVADPPFDVTGEWHGYLEGGLAREFWVTFFEDNYCIGILENYSGEFDQSNYQISDGHISIDLDSGSRDFLMEGTIENDNRMSGTWYSYFYGTNGTWWLERD